MKQHSLCFQYLQPGDRQPCSGNQITNTLFDVPEGATVPRVGEFVHLVRGDGREVFEVLAVTTQIVMFDASAPNWNSIVTVGPIGSPAKQVLSVVCT
jgi:hypothetical protein